jgi:hypothetical protein
MTKIKKTDLHTLEREDLIFYAKTLQMEVEDYIRENLKLGATIQELIDKLAGYTNA